LFCGGSTKVIISGQYRTTLNNDNKGNNAYEDRNSTVKEEWTTSQHTHDRREKQALSLAKDCYAMKLDLLTNATVVDDAIRLVTSIPNNNTHGEAVKPKADVCILVTTEDHLLQHLFL
jgi:hypothetical protein